MTYALPIDRSQVSVKLIHELQAEGIPEEDILYALHHQTIQRSRNAPVSSLRAILGLEAAPTSPPMPSRANSAPNQLDLIMVGVRAVQGNHQRKLDASKLRYERRRFADTLHITGQPVWANSVEEGSERERAFIEPLAPVQAAMLARVADLLRRKAREFDTIRRLGKRKLTTFEHHVRLFGDSAKEVLRFLINHQSWHKGRCFPSLEFIAEKTARSRRTVFEALQRLRALGLVEWIRRFVNLAEGKAKEQGPQREQTSNLYRCRLPHTIAQLLKLEQPQLPSDHLTLQEERDEAQVLMLTSLSTRELVKAMPTEPKALLALQAAAMRLDARAKLADIDVRECNIDTPPPETYIFNNQRSGPGRPTRLP